MLMVQGRAVGRCLAAESQDGGAADLGHGRPGYLVPVQLGLSVPRTYSPRVVRRVLSRCPASLRHAAGGAVHATAPLLALRAATGTESQGVVQSPCQSAENI
jgi:hypothetical protein